MSNMWEAATIDYEQERFDTLASAASIAVAGQQGFVLQASSKAEFDDRLALVAEAVAATIDRLTYEDQAMFPVVHQAVLAGWERDFGLLVEARQEETQRRNARRAYFRRQAADGNQWIVQPQTLSDGSKRDTWRMQVPGSGVTAVVQPFQTDATASPMASAKIEGYSWYVVDRHGGIMYRGEKPLGSLSEAQDAADRAASSNFYTGSKQRKLAWTEDESDVTPMARKLMQMTDDATDVDKWNYGPDGYRDEVETALVAKIKPLLSQITQADIDCLEDYNFHVTNRAIDRAKGRTAASKEEYAKTLIDDKDDSGELIDWEKERSKRESSLTAFGALSCPTCKADVSTGAKIFDHGDQQVLRAKCDSCGWSGSKRKPKKTSGFKVVDDQSGASNGTVYPNKEIADQADYGEGYSVQYTEDTPKSASWTKQANLWISHTGSRVMEVAEIDGRFVWGSYRLADDSVIAEGSAQTLDLAKSAAYGYTDDENASRKTAATWQVKRDGGIWFQAESEEAAEAWLKEQFDSGRVAPKREQWVIEPASWSTASKTAGENPFAKKDDKTDSDSDGEQDGPLQAGEKAEPKGDDQAAPAAEAPADQQAAPADPNAPAADPSVDGSGQDKGLAQDPASTSDAVDQQPADPTVMDVGQSTSMGFTMVEGGNGSIEVTFVREENGVYFFNGPTGEFGVGQMNGQWQDADGNTFTFGGAPAAQEGIGPAQEQAAAADAATPTPTAAPAPGAPAADPTADPNAQAAPQAAQPAAAPPVPAPAKDETANPAEDPAPAPAADKPAEPAKDDGDKKENPFAKKSSSYPSSFGNQGYEHVRSLMELSGVPVRDWSDKELLANLGRGDVQSEARSRNIWG